MLELLQYSTSSFWKFIGCAFLLYGCAYFTVNGIVRILSRLFRSIMVLSRGWPPQHLDADGDFLNQQKQDLGLD